MGSREGATMWARIRDNVRDVWRYTCKPIIPTMSICSASLLANISPCAVVRPLNTLDSYSGDWNKKGLSDTSICASRNKDSYWLVNLIGKDIGFKMSSVVCGSQSVNDNINQKQPLPVKLRKPNHTQSQSSQGVLDTTGTALQKQSDNFTLRKRLHELLQYCHSWPILPSTLTLPSLTKAFSDLSALPLQFAQLSDNCAIKKPYLSSSVSSKVLLFCGVQCNSPVMSNTDKYQDHYHQSSLVCTNNSNNSMASTPEVSMNCTRNMNPATSSGNQTPAKLACLQDSESFCSESCRCDMNSAMGQFVADKSNSTMLPNSSAPNKVVSNRHSRTVDANLSALTKLCSSCQVADSETFTSLNTIDTLGIVQDQPLDENKRKKTKKARPSAKKRRRLKQKREQDNHAPSGISGMLTVESHIGDDIHRDSLQVKMTVDHCRDCVMEDKFVVISGISMSNFVISPDSSSESDSDDTDGGFVDMDEAAALWDSFTNGIQHDPLSFQFTCTISSATALFSDANFETSSSINDANRKWNESYQEVSCVNETAGDIQTRKVHFPMQDTDLTAVHELTEWPDACMEARRGCWEEIARDRQRFGRRIQRVEESIGFCLTQAHRDIVYQTRFVDDFKWHQSDL